MDAKDNTNINVDLYIILYGNIKYFISYNPHTYKQ